MARKKTYKRIEEAFVDPKRKSGHALTAVKGGFQWRPIDDEEELDDEDIEEEDEEFDADEAQQKLVKANHTIDEQKKRIRKLEEELTTYKKLLHD